jgi:alanyl-tRNA synthetase
VVVAEALEGWDAVGLKALASAATRLEPTAAVALFTAASPALVVVAGGAEAGVDAGAAVRDLVSRFGGKGGGKADLAQGGSLEGDTQEMTSAAREILGS